MKKYIKILLTVVSAGLLTFGTQSVTYAQYDNGYDNSYDNDYDNYDDRNYNNQGGQQIGFDDFYEQLSPYGRWVNEPNYGRVWVANASNFQPYATNGYWTYTNYGWTWVSNYDWGWAPFHYGRWGHSNRNGWFWVPGYQWGPAWVSWSSASNMYGWAPLRPGMNFGVNISIGSFPASYWTFMPRRYMGNHNQHNYYVNRSRYTTIIRNTKIINNYGRGNGHRYSMGPQRREVERSTGRAVRQVRVVNSRSSKATGVRNNQLHVYRPSVRGRTNSKATRARKSTTPSRSTTPRSSNRSNVERKAPVRSQAKPSTRQRTEHANRSRATQQRQQKARQSEANKRTQQRTQQRTQAAQKRASQQQQTRQRKQHARQEKAQKAQKSRQRTQQSRQRTQRKQQAKPAQQSKARVQRSAPARSEHRSAPARSNSRSSSGRASRGR